MKYDGNEVIVGDEKYYNVDKLYYGRVNTQYSISSVQDELKYLPIFTLKVYVKSVNLWTQRLTDKQLHLYNIIKELRKEGLKYYEISHILNTETDFTTVRGKRFSSSGVHSTEKKIGRNLDRLTTTYYSQIKDVDISFKEISDEN